MSPEMKIIVSSVLTRRNNLRKLDIQAPISDSTISNNVQMYSISENLQASSNGVRSLGSVFISYSRKDYYFAESLTFALIQRDVAAWLDVKDLRPGVDWEQRLESAIDTASRLVVVVSPDSLMLCARDCRMEACIGPRHTSHSCVLQRKQGTAGAGRNASREFSRPVQAGSRFAGGPTDGTIQKGPGRISAVAFAPDRWRNRFFVVGHGLAAYGAC